jgi:hypothetical protein
MPPPPPEPALLSLDERIQLVEQRLLAREARLTQGWHGLTRRAERQLHPQRWLLTLAGALLTLGPALWALRRHAHKTAAAAPSAPSVPAPWWQGLPWVRGLSLAWPLLPPRWRDRVSPATAALVLALGLTLLRQLRRHPSAAP